ncbi:protein mono-ADP-ribosyltransferase PARP9-like [Antechinus flavipes]|uniref:protein mono-ADP-ribosyltransferase PARP9-like n=1 Tax=Antechinus flavipes TaxID=38775 RepID=UPI0022366A74|nr:protein mono-ADP-ribosyltransferase PARP9-like [Antechinus flavipes]
MEQKSLQIAIDSDHLKTLKSCESLFNDVINKKFQCTANLKSAMDSAKVFRTMLSSQIELSVWKDDLTNHPVDAVVNAANENLWHGGGLALALLRKGGPIVAKESENIIRFQQKVPVGNIAITSGGQLPCSKIIHAVGPQWSVIHREKCCSQLKEAIVNILEYVVSGSNGIKTVAIPAISSGIFGFPLNLCVGIIVDTIMTFSGYQKSKILKEIHLVSNEEPTVAAFKRSCEEFLGKNTSASPSLASITLNNVKLQIIEGFIEKQQVDAIVNSVSFQNPFSSGHISKAILEQAGIKIEEDFQKLSKTPKIQELVIVTKGFNLACQYVYHVAWPPVKDVKKILKDAMMKCLEKSCQHNINSLSFPALGTGNVNIPKEKAAHIMLEEVLRFSKDYPQKKLLVNFVIFPNDSKLSEIFKSELAKMKTMGMGQMAPKMNEESNKKFEVPQWSREGQKAAALEEARLPLIHLTGNNEEQLAAAKKWIAKLLQTQECRFIENNHIFYLGKEEHDQLSHMKDYFEVSISEDISPGKATLEIRGRLNSIIPMMLHIENLLWDVQINYAKKKFSRLTDQPFSIQPEGNLIKKHFVKDKKLEEKKKEFEKAGLEVQKVESVHNLFLLNAFKERKKKIWSKKANGNLNLTLYQEVPHQFCNLVSKAGFQRIYSMPLDSKYGYGIYFNKTLKNLVDNLRQTSDSDNTICVFEAEVATGSYCEGNPSYISLPSLASRTMDTYDSVVDSVKNPETFVIFDSTQALPLFLWTCVLKKSGFSQRETKNKGTSV